MPRYSQAGMTIIELIITLTILAAVASIAIVTLSDMGQTSRYEETSRRGQVAQRAVVGEPGEVSRFVNDMGRYPMVLVDMLSATDDEKEKFARWYLAELYDIEADDSVDGNRVYIYDTTESAAVRSRMCYVDTDFDYDFNADGGLDSDNKYPRTAFQIALKAGWNGPYLINQYEDFTDNYGEPWSVNVGTNAVKDAWDANWTTFRRDSDGSVELEVSPVMGDQIVSVRSDFSVQADNGGFFTSGDFGTQEEEEKYANDVEDLTFPFYSSHLFTDLTIKLFVRDYTGKWMNAGSAGTQETNSFNCMRVMLYVPLCERAVEPQLCEISAWCNSGSVTNTLGTRYRSWDGSAYVNHYSFYARDGNGNNKFTTSAPDAAGETGVIPDEIHTRCEVSGVSAATGMPPWNGVSEVTFTDVPVGRRKVWAYAYSTADSGNEGERYSPVQTVDIKPGHNVVELYLSEEVF